MLKISFIIIEYHSIEDITECVSSINNCHSSYGVEIVVSSNSMYIPEEQTKLRLLYPEVRWIFNIGNYGFAGGMNSGLQSCSGDIMVIMNPDVRIVTSNWDGIFQYILQNKRVGIIGPRIIDKNNNIQDSCRPFMSPYHFIKRVPQRFFKKKDVLLEKKFEYEQIQSVDWVIGACMLLRRDAFEKVGGLDEQYFLYVEDMDWCYRFWQRGYEVVYYPQLVVQYKGDRKSTSAIINRNVFSKYLLCHIKSYFRFLRKFGLRPVRSKSSTKSSSF